MKRLMTIVAATFLVALSGCSILGGPIDAAETSEQKAAALYGTYVVALELAADIAENDATPDHVVAALADAGEATKPTADALLAAMLELNAIKREFDAGETSTERIQIATLNLDDWINRAAPVIDRLLRAVAAARGD